ncbi:MAG TPA: Rieske (2Fe-2S) protein [Anaerolineales bacterium]|jgi:cytochrome b6-f complex iron-sulfur subunit
MDNPNRRRLLKSLVEGGIGASILSFLYPIVNFVLPPPSQGSGMESKEVGSENELQPNSGMVFQFGNEPALLVRTAEGELRAFTAICTHLGCTVNYEPDSKVIWCPCHNGMFDLHGRNIGGPPPRPLTEYKVNLRNGQIVVTKGA